MVHRLTAFWIARSPFDEAGSSPRFGVTGHGQADVVRILRWGGFRLSNGLDDFEIVQEVTYAELRRAPGFRYHVEFNMGPMVVRGVWYPYITTTPPDPWTLASELDPGRRATIAG
jgi:hypothetical protein